MTSKLAVRQQLEARSSMQEDKPPFHRRHVDQSEVIKKESSWEVVGRSHSGQRLTSVSCLQAHRDS